MRIAHLHVADRNNKGDYAIVLAVQELLRRQFPGSRINNFSAELLKNGGPAENKKINQADLVVIGGGGLFYSYFLPYSLDFISGIKKPIVIFGVGYIREIGAPALSKESAASVAYLARAAALVGVRDNRTKTFLLESGLSPAKIKVIGDPAALLSEKESSRFKRGDKTLKATKVSRATKDFKTISRDKFIKLPVRIGLNLNYSGWLGFGQWREDILRAYQEVVEYFKKEYGGVDGSGVEIYYLKHHPGEENIYPALKVKGLKIVDLSPREQKYVYGQLDLVIGMMLHAGVLAFGAGTPEISVAYDLRNYSFAEFIGCPELAVDLEKLKKGKLLERAKEVFKERRRYRVIFKRQKLAILKKQTQFLRNLKKLVVAS